MPKKEVERMEKFKKALEKVNQRYKKALERLAQ